jgi:hypothetical protein
VTDCSDTGHEAEGWRKFAAQAEIDQMADTSDLGLEGRDTQIEVHVPLAMDDICCLLKQSDVLLIAESKVGAETSRL